MGRVQIWVAPNPIPQLACVSDTSCLAWLSRDAPSTTRFIRTSLMAGVSARRTSFAGLKSGQSARP